MATFKKSIPVNAKTLKKAQQKKAEHYNAIKNNMADLKEYVEKTGLDGEYRDSLDALNKTTREIRLRVAELEALEYLAWTSQEAPVVSLRKQLFMATKLAHSEFLEEYMADYQERIESEGDLEGEDCAVEGSYVDESDWNENGWTFRNLIKRKIERFNNARKAFFEVLNKGK